MTSLIISVLKFRAFGSCTSLTGVYFKGNPPALRPQGADNWVPPFDGSENVTVRYLPGTTGCDFTYAGRPTEPWVLPYPVVLTIAPNYCIHTHAFGFRISWATNTSVLVEGTASLSIPMWTPLQTNTLVNGWTDFCDTQWSNFPSRFYRVRQL